MSLIALINPARGFLAMSAILAGYCLIRFYAYTSGNFLVLPYLLAAGALLGMADAGWRQVFQIAADADDNDVQTPTRGMLSTTAGYFVAVFTTLAGLMCAMTAGYNAFRTAGVFLLLSLARSALFRRTEIVSPLLGGLAWGVLFLIGMTAYPSFLEMLFIRETYLPVAFFTVYMVVACVLSQVCTSARPRETPDVEELASETASRLLEMRGDAIDGPVAWFAGGALALMPLALAWVMPWPWRWPSWGILAFLSLSIIAKLIPVLAYRTARDLEKFTDSVFRGSVLLSAGAVAGFGLYTMKEIYDGWGIPIPGREELAAMIIIILLGGPAWILRRQAPDE